MIESSCNFIFALSQYEHYNSLAAVEESYKRKRFQTVASQRMVTLGVEFWGVTLHNE